MSEPRLKELILRVLCERQAEALRHYEHASKGDDPQGALRARTITQFAEDIRAVLYSDDKKELDDE